MWRALFAAGLAALAAGALSACGSSGPSTEDEVRDAAVGALASEDTREFCRRLVSDRYIDEVLGDGGRAACEKSTLVEPNPGTPTVSAVAIKGEDESRAVVAVAISGGQLGGSAGHLEMVREGERWLLDRYGDDYLRSSFEAALRKVKGGALATPSLKACMGKQVAELDDERVRRIAYDANTDSEAMIADLLPLAENCPAALAEYGAKALTDGLFEAGEENPAYVRCVRDELEDSLFLTDIAPQLIGENPDEAAVYALEGLAVAAKKNCLP
jgi:hypothetical protein